MNHSRPPAHARARGADLRSGMLLITPQSAVARLSRTDRYRRACRCAGTPPRLCGGGRGCHQEVWQWSRPRKPCPRRAHRRYCSPRAPYGGRGSVERESSARGGCAATRHVLTRAPSLCPNLRAVPVRLRDRPRRRRQRPQPQPLDVDDCSVRPGYVPAACPLRARCLPTACFPRACTPLLLGAAARRPRTRESAPCCCPLLPATRRVAALFRALARHGRVGGWAAAATALSRTRRPAQPCTACSSARLECEARRA